MDKQQIIDTLRQKPEYAEIEYAGETRGFILGKRAFDIAKHKEGLQPEDILKGDDEGDLGEQLDMLARVLWCGFLPFPQTALPLEDVKALVTIGDMKHLEEALPDIFGDLAEEARQAVAGKGSAPATETG